MTKGEAIAGALRWMDEATVSGYAADSGEVADYRDRMATLLDGVLQLLGNVFRLRGKLTVEAANHVWQSVELPEDCVELEEIVQLSESGVRECVDYRLLGQRTLWLCGNGAYQVHYFRRPQQLAPTATNDAVLDCHPDAAVLVPLKLAADVMSGMEEQAELGAHLENKFASMVQNMLPAQQNGSRGITNVYGVGVCM